MMRKNKIWKGGGREIRAISDSPVGDKGGFYFGYRTVDENDKAKWVRGHFDTVADKYDFMNTLMSLGIHHLWKRKSVRMLKLREGDFVLDSCGGTGDLSILAAGAVGLQGRVILYDINRAMIESGLPNWAGKPFAECIYPVQGDAEQISFPDHHFDAAMVGFGIRNLTHMEQGFREMYRILKPGGKMMCLEFSKPTPAPFRWLYDFYSMHIMPLLGWAFVGSREAYTYLPESIRMFPLPDELNAILKRIGFSEVNYLRLTNGIAVIHLARK